MTRYLLTARFEVRTNGLANKARLTREAALRIARDRRSRGHKVEVIDSFSGTRIA